MWLRKIVGICLFSLAWLTCIAETFDSRFASLEVDANGKVISLREKPSGYEKFMKENYPDDWDSVNIRRSRDESNFQANKSGAADRVKAERERKKNRGI